MSYPAPPVRIPIVGEYDDSSWPERVRRVLAAGPGRLPRRFPYGARTALRQLSDGRAE
ncbi:hypothetical protein ABZ714_13990 [Streptomyces sp. NPDC006798]|uniref:hypothetical protein n=1 Tax=Streptomyces sp. NPDC006798 TaxID=3155462 RepID=UPI0033BFC01C